MIYLQGEEIVAINLTQLELYGEDAHQILKPNELESAVYRHMQYEDVHDVAAAILHSLLTSHIFLQGNKRTAVIAAQQVLVSEGLRIGLKDKAIAKRVIQIVEESWERERVAEWLRKFSEPSPEGLV